MRLSVDWISALVVSPLNDKSFVSDLESICRQYRHFYRNQLKCQPETCFPFIIDLLAQTFTLEGKNEMIDTLRRKIF